MKCAARFHLMRAAAIAAACLAFAPIAHSADALVFCGQSCSSDESKTSGIHCEKWTPAPGAGVCQARAFCSGSTPSGNCDVVLSAKALSLNSLGWSKPANIRKRLRLKGSSIGLYPLHFHTMHGNN